MTKEKQLKMKDIASIDYVAGEIEISEDEELNRSTGSLKIVISNVDDDSSEEPISSDSNLDKTPNNESHHQPQSQSIFMNKKHRLASTDSGFGSYGRSVLYTSGSIDSMANIITAPQFTSIHTKPIVTESNNSINNNNNEETTESQSQSQSQSQSLDDSGCGGDVATENSEKRDKILPLVTETTASEAIPQFVQRYEKIQTYQKNHRNTTITSIDDANNFELDARLINQNDGFHEIQCYVDENGSPRVREKRRVPRKRSTLKQELKARSLGASYDDNFAMRKMKTNETPSCVSFSRLFKKFRETFCKFLYF